MKLIDNTLHTMKIDKQINHFKSASSRHSKKSLNVDQTIMYEKVHKSLLPVLGSLKASKVRK